MKYIHSVYVFCILTLVTDALATITKVSKSQVQTRRRVSVQGILSLLLWLLLVSYLLTFIEAFGTEVKGHANDIVIILKGLKQKQISSAF